MKLSLAYSPCPNDCFIFDALVNGKIDTEGLQFEVWLEDVETLNRHALAGTHQVTKLSFHALAQVLGNYILLRSGAALGFNCGPLIISKKKITDPAAQIKSIAIPGRLTTANFLLSLAYPEITNKKELVFSDIENAVLSGEVDAGLIIHENRFTYEQKGLQKVRDLGEFWDEQIHAPIPLGGIAARRDLPPPVIEKVNRLIRKSVLHAFSYPDDSMEYVRRHAQEMSEEVMKKHIQLYVNDFSSDLGQTGIKAIKLLFEKAGRSGLFNIPDLPVMI